MSFDLDALIRDTLDRTKEADPAVIARRLVPKIPEAAAREVLARTLRDRVREIIRQQRTYEPPRKAPQSTRWAATAAWIRQRVYTGTEWKMLEACTAGDCDGVAHEYRRRERENAHRAVFFERLAVELRRTHAATVADLGTDLRAAA